MCARLRFWGPKTVLLGVRFGCVLGARFWRRPFWSPGAENHRPSVDSSSGLLPRCLLSAENAPTSTDSVCYMKITATTRRPPKTRVPKVGPPRGHFLACPPRPRARENHRCPGHFDLFVQPRVLLRIEHAGTVKERACLAALCARTCARPGGPVSAGGSPLGGPKTAPFGKHSLKF